VFQGPAQLALFSFWINALIQLSEALGENPPILNRHVSQRCKD